MASGQAYVLFSVEDSRCALPAQSVREVLPFPALFRPPGTPKVIAGFLNLGGEAVVVLETAVLLAPEAGRKAARERAEQHLILLPPSVGSAPFALVVDRVFDVAVIRQLETATEPQAQLPPDAMASRFWHEGDLIHLISVEGLLRLEERNRLDDLAAQARSRMDAWEDVP